MNSKDGINGTPSNAAHYSVVISGAGPTGLLTAIRLGQAGVRTLVVERHHELLPTTRAVGYQAVVLKALKKLGVLDLFKQHAYLNTDGIYWRDLSGNVLGHVQMTEGEYILLIGQKKVGELLLKELEKYPTVEVRFGTAYAGCEQQQAHPRCKVMLHDAATFDDYTVTADWLVGADGTNSTVRRSLCIPFEGITFRNDVVIGCDVSYDFAAAGFGVMNYVRDGDFSAAVVYTGQKGFDGDPDSTGQNGSNGNPDSTTLWRIAFAEPTGLSQRPEDVHARAWIQVKRLITPGTEDDFIIHRAEPYQLHQRCASTAITGRASLIGDALHTNNPAGGFGLTMGILDACVIGDVLSRVCRGEAPESQVEKAAQERRRIWLDVTDPLSSNMFKMLRSNTAEDGEARQAYFEKLNNDPNASKNVRAMIERMAGDEMRAY